MSRKASESVRDAPRAGLPPSKGREVAGLVLAAAAVLLGAGLATYHPHDPSFLVAPAGEPARDNLIGAVGANLAAVGFGVSTFLSASAEAAPRLSVVPVSCSQPTTAELEASIVAPPQNLNH